MPFTATEIDSASNIETVDVMMGRIATESQLSQAAMDAADDIRVSAAAAAINFCSAWPSTRPVIEFIRDSLLKGGGWKAVLRWAVNKGIDAGQKYYQTSCPVSRQI